MLGIEGGGNPPLNPVELEVEFSKKAKERILHEEIEIYGQSDTVDIKAGTPVVEICREHKISSALFYRWRSRFGGMDVSMMKRMKELETENARLKKCMLKSGSTPRYSNRPLKKSGESVFAPEAGAKGGKRQVYFHPAFL